jgi:hypothetical protein
MNINIDMMQLYWFPGNANQRSIFDFNSGVLQIESPGFPLVPVDSNNFGNVITLADGTGYSLLGKYLMDSNFSTVNNTESLFSNLSPTVANCSFSPDFNNKNYANLYFIDSGGLNYVHISRNLLKESTADVIAIMPLTLPPMLNSPLCILGDSINGGNWLFYITEYNKVHKLVSLYCKDGQSTSYSSVFLPCGGAPICIDVKSNRIAIIRDDASLVYGEIVVQTESIDVQFTEIISGLSSTLIQSAFSADGNSLFYMTDIGGAHYVNYRNLTTGSITQEPTTGKYIALKCGPDDVIYGLSIKTIGTATLLTVTPTTPVDGFSVSEILVPTNGGYFPATEWRDNIS